MAVYSAGSASLTIVPDAREFRSKLEADLRKIQVDYAVQISADLARARGDLDKFRAEQEGRAIHLRAEVDRDHLKKSFDSMRGDFANVGESLGKALKIDAATVGIDLLPALATGLASVAQALEQVADAGLAVPGILAGVGASASSVLLALGGVKDAWSAVSKAADVSGADQVRQAQQVTNATNSFRNALVDERNAQKDLTDARKDARHALEDLNIELRGGALNEKEAVLEAQKARRDLAEGHFKDALDYQEQQLRVQDADQRVVESHQHNIELREKVNDTNSKGIENSDKVVAANERLTRSHQAVQSAQTGLATVGADTPAAKAAEAMAKLSPATRELVQTVLDLKPAFLDLRNADAEALFSGVGKSVKELATADLPNLKTGMSAVAGAINGDIKQLLSSVGSNSSKSFIDNIFGNTANADAKVKAAIDPIVHAFGTLASIGSNTLPRLADAVTNVANRFNNFISAAADDGRLSKWINDGETAFTHLGEIAIHLGETFHGVSEAVGGKGLLADLDHVTGKMAAFVNSAEGQQKLTKLFQEGRDELHKWEPVVENVAHMLPEVFRAAKTTADEFLPIVKGVTDILAKNPALLQNILDGYLAWNTVIGPIASVAGAVGGVIKVVKELKGFINDIGPAMKATTAVMEAESAKQVASEERVAASAVEADAAAGGTGAAGRLARVGGLLGAAAGPVGIAAAGGLLLYDTLNGQDERENAFQKDMANAKTPEERDEVLKRYGRYIPPLAGTPGGPPAGAPALPGTPKQLLGPSGQPNVGATGSMSDQAAWEALANQGDPMAKWVIGGADSADMAKRAQWALAHQDQDKPGWQPPQSYAVGGGTPHSSGPLPDGGYDAVIHPKEWVSNPTGRKALGDPFLAAANHGVVDTSLLPHFDKGGPGDYSASPIPPSPPSPLPPGWSSNYSPWPWDKADSSMAIPDHGRPGGVFNPGIKIDTSMATSSSLPHFDVGGPGDGDIHDDTTTVQGPDPRTAPPAPGSLAPDSIAPNPTGGPGAPGILNQVIGGVISGAQGPIGNAISFGAGLIQQGASANGSGGIPGLGGIGGGGRSGPIPGLWGLAQAGSDPNALAAWGSQTANWTANFATKTLGSAAQIGLQGGLDFWGLGDSALSPNNVYNQAAQKTAGFYLGDQSPFRGLGGAPPAGDIGSQTVTLPTGETVQIPTYGTAQGVNGLPGAPVSGSLSDADIHAISYAQQHAVGQPYVYGGVGGGPPGTPGGYDCSGIGSAIYAAAKGLPQGTRYFTTESDFGALGFVPGYQPGALNIGVMRGGGGPNSHMVLTLPNGVNVESGGATDTTQYGGSARGARDLPLQWHLALPGAMPPPGGIPGLPPTLYDQGGALPAGLSLVSNQTQQPETVITQQQTQALQAVANNALSQPTPSPSLPQTPDAGHLHEPSQAQAPQAPEQPRSTPATPVINPGGNTPTLPTQTPTGGGPQPGLAAPQVAAAPTSLDHNLKAIDTGIDSAASAIGQAVSTAIGIAGAAAGSFPGASGAGAAIGAIGPYAAGLIKEGGKIAKDVVNVPSSFLVGDVTGGTQDLAYGAQLRPAQNSPNVAQSVNTNITNISGNYELRAAMDAHELQQQQDQQAYMASHPRVSA